MISKLNDLVCIELEVNSEGEIGRIKKNFWFFFLRILEFFGG